ncbi:MAG TPA: O-antigen ligase family protein [Pyrinomonadaceae bacterium]
MAAPTSRNVGGALVVRRANVAAGRLSSLIFAALVAVVPLSSIPYGSVEPLWTALFEAWVFLLAALWAMEGALSGRWVSRAHAPVLPGLALAAYALLQSFDFGGAAVSYDPYETRLVALLLLAYTSYLALLLRYTENERRLRALLYAVVAAGLASALFGVARQTAQRGGEGFLLEHLRPGAGYAQFVNRNHFAYLAEMALGVLLGLVAGRGVARGKVLVPLALALPLWAALVLSNSRGGILAMLCQVIFLGACFGVTRARGADSAEGAGATPSPLDRVAGSKAARAGLVFALLLTITVGVVWLGGDAVAERVASVGEEVTAGATDATRSGRKDIWAATWASFAEHPLFGVGFGGYWVAVSGRHEGSGGLVPQQAHNDYLEVLASGGLVGAAVVFAFLLLLVRRSVPRLREGSPFARAACLGALTGLCGVAVHSLFEFGLHVPSNAFASLALAAAAAAAQPRKRPKN